MKHNIKRPMDDIRTKSKSGGKFRKIVRYFLYTIVGFMALFVATVLFFIATIPLPDISNFDKRIISESTKIYDRSGKVLLYDAHNAIRRTVVDLDQMSPYIAKASIAIEDDQFYNHKGVRIKSIIRAFVSTLFKGDTQGGSTLTQQIIKNTLLTRDQTITRKIKEIILAVRLEQKLDKNQILNIYLNEAPYSGNVYGVEEASQVYFKKHAKDVTLKEASYLAAIPKGPTYYDPSGTHRAELDERAAYVLVRMHSLGFITNEEYQNAQKEPIIFVPQAAEAIKAPHFVFYVQKYLEEKYGKDKVQKEGLRVISTLDYDLQVYAEQEALSEALKNERDFGGSNIAMVATDPKTGQILSMVGSRDFFDKKIDGQFNVADSARQPGSSFKPFVYSTAFKEGYRPETVLFDVLTEFNPSCDASGHDTAAECYSPEDFDNKYEGPISLKKAIAESRNIPSVQLLYLVGISDALETAKSMGITTLKNPRNYGLSLALGAGEVKPVDMASAYGVFATGGIRHPSTPILRVEDRKGNVLEEYKDDPGTQVLPDYVASAISNILSDNVLRTPSFGANSSLNVPGYSVAVKTGTTNSNRDAWIVGYTPSISVAVWVGNNNNTVMKKGGAQLAGPLWNKVILKFLNGRPDEPFPNIPIPDTGGAPVIHGFWQGGETFYTDKISGGVATDLTPIAARETHVITNVHSILYWIDKDNPLGPKPTNPTSDPQFRHWEQSVQNWWANNGGHVVSASDIPTYTDSVHTSINPISFALEGITDGQVQSINNPINISIVKDGADFQIQKADIYIDSKKISTLKSAPWVTTINPNKIPLTIGAHTLNVTVFDTLLNQNTNTISFSLVEPVLN